MSGRLLERLISLTTLGAVAFLALSALVILGVAVFTLLRPFLTRSFALEDVLLAIALAVITVGVGDLALTISREESLRRTRPRNPVITADLVARFLFVVVTTLAIDNLFTVVRSEVQRNAPQLLISAALVVATAVLVLATAFFYQRTHRRPEPAPPADQEAPG